MTRNARRVDHHGGPRQAAASLTSIMVSSAKNKFMLKEISIVVCKKEECSWNKLFE